MRFVRVIFLLAAIFSAFISTAGAALDGSGTEAENHGNHGLLPFAPEPENIYYLQARGSGAGDSCASGSGITLAFITAATERVTPADTVASIKHSAGGDVLWSPFDSRGRKSTTPTDTATRLGIILDTTGADWRVVYLVDGEKVATATLETKPAITHVGFVGSPRAGADVHDFKLTRVDPPGAGEHPHMLLEKDEFSALQDKASRSPWREIKAFAGSAYDTLEYAPEPNTHPKFKANRLANIFSQSALWYILSPDDRDKAIETIVDSLKHYNDLKKTYRLPYSWNRWVPASNSLACAIHALDIVYEDLDLFERAYFLSIIQDFVDMLYENESKWGHVWAHYGVLITWETFNRRYNKVKPYANMHHMWLQRTTTRDGAYVGSPGYAKARWFGDQSRGVTKSWTLDLLELTGQDYPLWGANNNMATLYEHAFVFGTTPFRSHTIFGDTLSVHPTNKPHGKLWAMHNYAEHLPALAAWYIRDPREPSADTPLPQMGEFAGYLLPTYILGKRLPPPQHPTSRIYTRSGAAFREDSPSPKGLMACMWNPVMENFRLSHSHQETNAIYLAGLGEHLLWNGGRSYASPPAPGSARQRKSQTANTVMIYPPGGPPNYHQDENGGGIVEGFLTDRIDYASGDAGRAIDEGKFLRNLVFVHPEGNTPGYVCLFDEVKVKEPRHHVFSQFRPNASTHVDRVGNRQLTWPVDVYEVTPGGSERLSVFLGTAPESIEFTKQEIYAHGTFRRRGHADGGATIQAMRLGYVPDAEGLARFNTVLFPHLKGTKPEMSRIETASVTGTRVRHLNGPIDFAIESSGEKRVQHQNVSLRAKAALYRVDLEGELLWFFLRKAYHFAYGQYQLSSDQPLSLFLLAEGKGTIISPGAQITLRSPDIQEVLINGESQSKPRTEKGGVSLFIPKGRHDIELLTR